MMIAALAREEGGHEVYGKAPPIDFEELIDFGPDVIVMGLFRRRSAFNRPIEDLQRDVLGLETLTELENYPAIAVVPIVILGNGIEEFEVPLHLNYDLFLFFPDDMHLFLPKLNELAAKEKTRRRISGYVCPTCGSRLTYTSTQRDLFCPRDGTAVALLDNGKCLYLPQGQDRSIPCSTDDITSPMAKRKPRDGAP